MDLSRWYSNFIDLRVKQTPSLYYNKFKHKLVYNVEFRVRYDKSYDFTSITGGSNLIEQRIEKAKVFADLYENRSSDCRMRLENYSLSIFHDDIDYLYNLATEHLGAYKSSLSVLYTSLTSTSQQAIEVGNFIMKTDIGYQYRANLRSGLYNRQDNIACANYLVGLGDEVRASKNLLHELRNYKYIQSRYFYLKDPAVASMIMLIQPKLIKSVQKIVVQ